MNRLRPLPALLLLLALAGPALAEPVTITLLHSNDVYEIAPQRARAGSRPS